jgi:hypothetical protein
LNEKLSKWISFFLLSYIFHTEYILGFLLNGIISFNILRTYKKQENDTRDGDKVHLIFAKEAGM